MNELNLVEKLLQDKIRDRIYDHLKGQSFSPIIVEIDPTTFCNLNCPECVNRNLLNKEVFNHELLINSIIDLHQSGIQGIIFIGGGEPLLYPNIVDALELCFRLGIKVGLVTNGILINKYINVIAKTVSWIRVSVDASSEEEYFALKGSNMFSRVIDNIWELRKYSSIKIGYSFLIIEKENCKGEIVSNAEQIIEGASIADKLKCNYYEIKPMVDKNHFLINYTNDTIAKIQICKNVLFSRKYECIKIIYPHSLDHILKGYSTQKKAYNKCLISAFRTLVTPYGIFPCPYKRGITEKCIGDIAHVEPDFWTSHKRIDIINSLVDPSIDCSFYCIRHRSNLFLNAVFELYNNNVDMLSLMQNYVLDDVFI